MIKLVLPLAFLFAGLGIGVGAGVFLAIPDPDTAEVKSNDAKPDVVEKKSTKSKKSEGKAGFDYLKMTKQFVVPVVQDEEISALVTMSLSLEIDPSITERFYAIEPKLRDGFLQVMFDHANIGGFNGVFTQSDNLSVLRRSLLEVARKDLGEDVSQVLIMSVSRQDT